MDSVKKFKRWIKEYGAVAPSSSFLVNEMTKPVFWQGVELVIELGAGSGVITKEILRKLSSSGKLIVFEINPKFCDKLFAIDDSRLVVINDRAELMDKYLGSAKADCIISGIPIGNLSRYEFAELARAIKRNLNFGGQFVQFQYFLASYLRVRREFSEMKTSFVPINLPPAFVYVCR